MNRNVIIPIIVLVIALVLLGLGFYYAGTHQLSLPGPSDTSSNPLINSSSSTSSSSSTAQGFNSLRNLFSTNQTEMCTFSESNSAGSVSGTLYTAPSELRGDFTVKSAGQAAYDTHLIRNQAQLSLWSGAQGIQMAFTDFINTKQSSSAAINLDQSFSYKCQAWAKDNSKFQLPAGVIFQKVPASAASST